MTDRLLVIEDGHVVQQGLPRGGRPSARNAVHRPPGRAEPVRRGPRARRDGPARRRRRARCRRRPRDTPPGRVLVTVRPTAIAVHTIRPEHSSPRNVWPGLVAGLELLTDRIRVQVDAAPSAMVDVTADAVADLRLAAGDPVWLSVKATEVDVYVEDRPARTLP